VFPIMSTRLDGIICTPEEYSRSLNDSSIHCLTRGQSIGLTASPILQTCTFYADFLNLVGCRVRLRFTSRSLMGFRDYFRKPIYRILIHLIKDIIQ